MKKILSILSTISLFTTISTNTIACNKPNENNKPNKQIKQKNIAQQPPQNSNWKLITNIEEEFNINNNKFYFFLNLLDVNRYGIYLVKNENNNIQIGENNRWDLKTYNPESFVMFATANIKNIYRWNGVGEPQTPEINKDTGEITNWNE
jgi:hypothetical protein